MVNQTKLHRWQDEQSMDLSHIVNLRKPLDDIISLFQSFHIPTGSSGPQVPTFHVETTLSILQSLLSRYDTTMDALTQARDAVTRIDAKQTVNQQQISEWASSTLSVLHDTRAALISQHHRTNHQLSEREILKNRLSRCEKDRQSSQQVVLSLVEKLNDAEECLVIQNKERKQLESKLLRLKTQVNQITKWKEHMSGLGVATELRTKKGGI